MMVILSVSVIAFCLLLQVEDSSLSGKKPERGKAVKKPIIPKVEEPEKTGRNSPSPPPVPPNCNNPPSVSYFIHPFCSTALNISLSAHDNLMISCLSLHSYWRLLLKELEIESLDESDSISFMAELMDKVL